MTALPWITRAPGAPYFVTEDGDPWTPIGANDSVAWVDLNPLFRRRELGAVRDHLRMLADHGVTVIRLMLEYAQGRHRYLERPAGTFNPAMVALWDDLFQLCEETGLRLLLTPFDTFFTWIHWRHHPYNRANGGPCKHPSVFLTCRETREAIKARLSFATERWGASGAVFAWDLWNEIHPAHAGGDPSLFAPFITDVADHLRTLETRLHGRAHLQTVSIFGPELYSHPAAADPIFRHPALDFASSHFYEHGTIDDPKDTVAAALSFGRLTRESLSHISDSRPFVESEHGPIHRFKDKKRPLPEAFDDEYFRHMAWAHLASGGAGGGMRWPNRTPHVLTPGMRRAQRAMSRFLPLIAWDRFRRVNLNEEVALDDPAVAAWACGDRDQAVAFVLRMTVRKGGRVDGSRGGTMTLRIPGLSPGPRRAILWDTSEGQEAGCLDAVAGEDGWLALTLPLRADLAVAVTPP